MPYFLSKLTAYLISFIDEAPVDNKTGFLADLKGIFDRSVLGDLGLRSYRL